MKPFNARRTMVFLPMRTTPSPRRDCRISCICCEETLSTVTMKIDLQSQHVSCHACVATYLYSSRRTLSLSAHN